MKINKTLTLDEYILEVLGHTYIQKQLTGYKCDFISNNEMKIMIIPLNGLILFFTSSLYKSLTLFIISICMMCFVFVLQFNQKYSYVTINRKILDSDRVKYLTEYKQYLEIKIYN